MSITTAQIFQIGGLVVSTIAGAAATFSALGFSQNTVTAITALAAFAGIMWNGIGTILTGQAAVVREVAAMPGVTKITTNTSANEALRSVAADPNQPKVESPK